MHFNFLYTIPSSSNQYWLLLMNDVIHECRQHMVGRSCSDSESGANDGPDLSPRESKATESMTFQGVDELAEMDDWASAWKEAQERGEAWGGRGKGGRGIQRNTWQPKDIYVEGEEAVPCRSV